MSRSPRPGEIWERAAFGSVLLFAMGASTFIVFALGALGPLITDDLSLSRSLFGALTTAMFAIGAVVSPFSGHMVDLFGGRKAVLALFLIAAVTAAGIALAPSYPLMLGVAPLAGLAISLANPSTNKLLAENPGPSGQGVILGIKQSGVHIAGLLAGVILPVAAVNLGWRLTLFLCAVTLLTGCVMAILWLPRDDVTRSVRVHTGSRPIAHVVGWLSGYGFLMGMSVAALGVYLPLYVHEALGFEIALSGMPVAVMSLLGIASRIVWARAVDRDVAHVSLPLAAIAVMSTLFGLLVLVADMGPRWLVWVGVAGLGVSASAWNSVGMLAVIKNLDARDAGRASGMVLFGFYGGYVVSPIAFGLSVDTFGTYTWGWLATALVFALAALLAALWHLRLGPEPAWMRP